MPWYVFSLIALASASLYSICQKWALNLKISEKLFLLCYFLSSFIGFLALTFKSLPDLFSGAKVLPFLLWGFLVAVFSMIGNIFSIKAFAKAPNPAYVDAIRNGNSILILFLSVLFFQSSITALKFFGAVLILLGLIPLMFDKKRKFNWQGQWQYWALGAMLAFTGMILVTKKMLVLGFSAQAILFILFFFATINFLIINRFQFQDKNPPIGRNLRKLVVAVVLALVFVFISNLSHFTAVGKAPNPGYPQAILNSSMVLTLLLARLLLPFYSGGHFDLKKWLGILVVFGGIILLIFG